MKSMKALQVAPGGVVSLSEVPLPHPLSDEALVQIVRAGVCNTDLEIIKGYKGMLGTIGHEFVGIVSQLPSEQCKGSTIKVGDRVVGEINLACDKCPTCERGGVARRNHCERRKVLGIVKKDGCFAEYITLPVKNLLLVPEEIPSRSAVFVEPLAAAYRIVEQMAFEKSQKVAIIGDGKLGLLIAKVLATTCVENLSIFGKHTHKMALVPSSFGKHEVIDSTATDFADQFDVTIEASGSPSGVMLVAGITKPLGTVVLKTTCASGAEDFNTAPFVVKELTVVGSRCGNFPMALEALKAGAIEVDRLIEKEYDFRDAVHAIAHAGKRGAAKIQLVMLPEENL